MIKRFIYCSLFLLLAFDYSFAQQSIPQDTIITLERFACYGKCPAYKLTISADGTIVFEPREYINDETGEEFFSGKYAKSKLSANQMNELLSEFEKINYFSLQKTYGQSWKLKKSKTCPEIWTDSSSAETSLQMNGKRKTIWHYYGCQGTKILEQLTNLEKRIDEIVNSNQWIELNKYPKSTSIR